MFVTVYSQPSCSAAVLKMFAVSEDRPAPVSSDYRKDARRLSRPTKIDGPFSTQVSAEEKVQRRLQRFHADALHVKKAILPKVSSGQTTLSPVSHDTTYSDTDEFRTRQHRSYFTSSEYTVFVRPLCDVGH